MDGSTEMQMGRVYYGVAEPDLFLNNVNEADRLVPEEMPLMVAIQEHSASFWGITFCQNWASCFSYCSFCIVRICSQMMTAAKSRDAVVRPKDRIEILSPLKLEKYKNRTRCY
jgi:hypothetical protein